MPFILSFNLANNAGDNICVGIYKYGIWDFHFYILRLLTKITKPIVARNSEDIKLVGQKRNIRSTELDGKNYALLIKRQFM